MDLGSSPGFQKYRIIQEEYERPPNRDALLSKVRDLINAGGVQQLVIESGAPIRVRRSIPVDPNEPTLPEGLPEDDMMSAVRNAPMEEFLMVGKLTSHEYLFRAFGILTAKKLRPLVLIANNKSDLLAWLHVDKFAEVTEVYGTAIMFHKEVPHDGAVLVGCQPELQDSVAFSLKLEINVKK